MTAHMRPANAPTEPSVTANPDISQRAISNKAEFDVSMLEKIDERLNFRPSTSALDKSRA